MLIPFDDYPIHQTSEPLVHAGLGHPNQYDRYWFNGYTEDFYFAFALGLYPNRGIIDAAFSVVCNGIQRSVFASGRIPEDPTVTRIGPVTLNIVAPMRISQITVDAPEHGLIADLTATARTSVFEEDRAIHNQGRRRSWDSTRATQMIQWAGILASGSERITIGDSTVYGTKDRSWGVRPLGVPWQAAPEPGSDQVYFVWAPLNFDDIALHFMQHENADGIPWASTAAILPVIDAQSDVCSPSHTRRLDRIDHYIRWAPRLRRAREARLTLVGSPDTADTVSLEPLLPFRMKGVGYFHPTRAHGVWHDELSIAGEEFAVSDLDNLRADCIHLQQVVRASWGERRGIGVLEQAVFGPYAPAGFTGAADGFGA